VSASPPAPETATGDEAGGVGLRLDAQVSLGALDLDVSLEAAPGELVALLGPNGAGKTTVLRCVAGLQPLDAGRVCLDGTVLDDPDAEVFVPPEQRPVGVVFQDYLLFPSMSALENVAFGLRARGVGRREARARAGAWLARVGLDDFARHAPRQLSGGQQQRVALARALVLRPAVLLLDEPLGALDAKLRRQLRVELKALQEEVGITFLFVTHDQEEALSMSDRVAVMNQGRVEQVGTPRALYDEPATLFVANFLAVSNVMAATVEGDGLDGQRLRVGEFALRAAHRDGHGAGLVGRAVTLMVRPERVVLEPYDPVARDNRLPAIVERTVYLGPSTHVVARLATGATIQASVANTGGEAGFRHGTPVWAHLPADAIRVLAASPAAPPDPGGAAGSPEPVALAVSA